MYQRWKSRFIVGVGYIIGQGVDSVVIYGFYISAGITFGFDDEYNMGYSDGSFYVSNYCKPVDWLTAIQRNWI